MSFVPEVTKNPSGGIDAKLTASHTIGDPSHSLTGGVFAAGSTSTPHQLSTGAFAAYNNNGHGLALSKTHTTGFGSVTTGSANLNLLQDQTHNLNANAFKSQTNLNNGFKYDTIGGGLGYNHVQGHGVSVTASQIPQIGGTTVGVGANANIWRTPDRAGSLDLSGSASKTFGGPFNGQKNYGVGLGFTHRF